MGPRTFRRLPAEITGPEAKMTLDNGAAEATPEGKDHEGQVYGGEDHPGREQVGREQVSREQVGREQVGREHEVPKREVSKREGKDRDVAREQWEELPRWQQTSIIALAAVEVVLTTTAIVDLVRRPRAGVRGPKTLWFLGFAVQPFGPITYLALGRRR